MSTVQSLADTTAYLAGVSGDGTSNGALSHYVNKLLAAATVALVAVFAVLAAMGGGKTKGDGRFAAGGGRHGADASGKYKALLDLGFRFAMVEGMVIAAWGLARIGVFLVTGAVGG